MVMSKCFGFQASAGLFDPGVCARMGVKIISREGRRTACPEVPDIVSVGVVRECRGIRKW